MMERDLNFKRLFRMYVLNIWMLVLVGIIVAASIGAVSKVSRNATLTRAVYLVFDLESSAYKELDTKKYTYTDAYRGLLNGNVLQESVGFSEEERSILAGRNMTVNFNCYTITLNLSSDEDVEKGKNILNKWIEESEKWMKEKFKDDSIEVETFTDDVTIDSGETQYIMLIIIGFVVGAVLAAMALFVWFVLDKKIRNEEDVLYYTGVECVGTVKRRK